MPKLAKRSERVGINLTPHQNQQLQAAAHQAKQTPAAYVYALVCQVLETPTSEGKDEGVRSPDWVDLVAELYGIFDALTQQLEEQAKGAEDGAVQDDLLLLFKEMNGRIEDAQQRLKLLHDVMAAEE